MGLIEGAITCRLGIWAQAYCKASLSWTMSTKKNSSRVVGPEASVAPGCLLELQRQEGRGVAQAVDADQQPGLDLRRPFQEPLVVARHGDQAGNDQKRIDGDHDAVQRIVLHAHEHELQGRDDEEDDEQRAMVAGPRGRERDELAEGPKSARPESTTVAVWPKKNVAARIEQSTHQACTRMRKVSRMAVFRPLSLRARRARMMTVAAASRTSTLTTSPNVLGSKAPTWIGPLQFLQPPHRVRARSRNTSFDSPDSSHIGGPKVMQLSSGTGRNLPRGRIRFMLSMYTGINSRSGRFLLR